MSKMYHVNPLTGAPNLCRAKKGKCPYGGSSGEENHFKTHSEAQRYSQELLEKQYSMLPSENSQDVLNKINEKKRIKFEDVEILMNKRHDEIVREINNTRNRGLLAGVIEGELKFENWTYVGAALQNNNLSKEFLDEVLMDYPDEFDSTTRQYAASSHLLTADDLEYMIENDEDIYEVRTLAMMNRNVDKDYIENIVKTKTPEELSKLPYASIFFDWKHKDNDVVNSVRASVESMDDYEKNRRESARLQNKYINVKDRIRANI